MRFSQVFAAVAALVSSASAADDKPMDLGSVLSQNKDLSQFYSLIKRYPDILLQLPNYNGVTIVAPSNKAFKNIPYTSLNDVWNPDDKAATVPLLQYHILQGTVAMGALEAGPSVVKSTLLTSSKFTNVTSGQNVLINKQSDGTGTFTTSMGTRCTVTDSDILFQGGLIQVVDNLLIPPARLGETSEAFQVPDFLGALYASDLMPKLAYEKNITIFVPQNIAVDAVGGFLQGLDKDALARVLEYHIVPNEVLVSSALTNGSEYETLARDAAGNGQQESLHVTIAGNNKFVGAAQIVQPDILIANGIMHVISNVLNPDSAARPNPTLPTQAAVFPLSTASGAFTSDLPCTVSCPVTDTPTATPSAASETASSSSLFTTSSEDAAPARCTGKILGAAAGLIGMGAGMVLL